MKGIMPMKEKCYFHDNEAILNFTHQPPGSTTQLLDSDFFNTFLDHYLDVPGGKPQVL